mmetsp:Transcript_8746/g.28169  ORF Transcript_8746/g.28169 Transcript_8746/m.28169 type:complete len:372 (-) Transcript_8746:56-1171(-)
MPPSPFSCTCPSRTCTPPRTTSPICSTAAAHTRTRRGGARLAMHWQKPTPLLVGSWPPWTRPMSGPTRWCSSLATMARGLRSAPRVGRPACSPGLSPGTGTWARGRRGRVASAKPLSPTGTESSLQALAQQRWCRRWTFSQPCSTSRNFLCLSTDPSTADRRATCFSAHPASHGTTCSSSTADLTGRPPRQPPATGRTRRTGRLARAWVGARSSRPPRRAAPWSDTRMGLSCSKSSTTRPRRTRSASTSPRIPTPSLPLCWPSCRRPTRPRWQRWAVTPRRMHPTALARAQARTASAATENGRAIATAPRPGWQRRRKKRQRGVSCHKNSTSWPWPACALCVLPMSTCYLEASTHGLLIMDGHAHIIHGSF